MKCKDAISPTSCWSHYNTTKENSSDEQHQKADCVS